MHLLYNVILNQLVTIARILGNTDLHYENANCKNLSIYNNTTSITDVYCYNGSKCNNIEIESINSDLTLECHGNFISEQGNLEKAYETKCENISINNKNTLYCGNAECNDIHLHDNSYLICNNNSIGNVLKNVLEKFKKYFNNQYTCNESTVLEPSFVSNMAICKNICNEFSNCNYFSFF